MNNVIIPLCTPTVLPSVVLPFFFFFLSLSLLEGKLPENRDFILGVCCFLPRWQDTSGPHRPLEQYLRMNGLQRAHNLAQFSCLVPF